MKKNIMLRILFVVSVLILLMIVYEIADDYDISRTVVKTNATPISNKTIILDAGHGFPDEGAFLLHKENKQLTFYK